LKARTASEGACWRAARFGPSGRRPGFPVGLSHGVLNPTSWPLKRRWTSGVGVWSFRQWNWKWGSPETLP